MSYQMYCGLLFLIFVFIEELIWKTQAGNTRKVFYYE